MGLAGTAVSWLINLPVRAVWFVLSLVTVCGLQVRVNVVSKIDGADGEGDAGGVGESVGSGVGVEVGAVSNWAIMVPGPLMVAYVSVFVGSAMPIAPVVLQPEKRYFSVGVAEMGTFAPESVQVVARGVTVPSPVGLLVNVT